NLFLRWMVRPADGVDFGLWRRVHPKDLVIPLDTHIHRMAKNLGLTRRNDLSWKTAVEVTRALARADPDDPVGYYCAPCHFGMRGRCPRTRAASDRRRCPLLAVCRHPALLRGG